MLQYGLESNVYLPNYVPPISLGFRHLIGFHDTELCPANSGGVIQFNMDEELEP